MLKKINTFRVISFIAFAFMIFSILAAYQGYQSRSSFLENAEKAEGEIIELVRQRKAYRPKIRFETKAGEIVTIEKGNFTTDTTKIPVGKKVDLLYFPPNPEDAQIDDFWAIWFIPIFFLLSGIAPFVFLQILRLILKPRPSEIS